MASPIANTFEGGTDNVTLSAANTGGASGTAITSITVSGATTIQFSTAFTRGAMACRHSYAITQAGYLVWNFSPTATTTRTRWRFYIYVPTGQAIATQDLFVARSAAAAIATIGTNSSSQLVVKNSAGTTRGTASSALPFDTWVRVEVALAVGTTTSNGTIEVSYYTGDSGSAIQSILSSAVENTGTVAMTLIRLGSVATVASARSIYYDGFAGDENAAGFIGPSGALADTSTAVTAALTAAANRTTFVDTGTPLTAALSASTSLAAVATSSSPVTLAPSATASLATTAGTATPLTAGLSAAASRTTFVDSALAATVALTASAAVTKQATTSSPVTVTSSATAALSTAASTSTAETVALTAAATRSTPASATSAETVNLTAAATRNTSGATATPITLALTASATVTHTATASASVTVALIAQATVSTNLTNVTVTGGLGVHRWTGRLPTPVGTANLGAEGTRGSLDPPDSLGTIPERRWKAEL